VFSKLPLLLLGLTCQGCFGFDNRNIAREEFLKVESYMYQVGRASKKLNGPVSELGIVHGLLR
jgi:hypothetical protein